MPGLGTGREDGTVLVGIKRLVPHPLAIRLLRQWIPRSWDFLRRVMLLTTFQIVLGERLELKQWYMGPHLGQICLAMQTSYFLLKPKPQVCTSEMALDLLYLPVCSFPQGSHTE